MGGKCNILVPEEFVLQLVTRPDLRHKYQRFSFSDHVDVSF